MLGFLDVATRPDNEAETSFKEALERSPDDELRALVDMGWGVACYQASRLHQSILHYHYAKERSPGLATVYADLFAVGRARWFPAADQPHALEDLYGYDAPSFRSPFFGFELVLPAGFQIDKASPYDPSAGPSLVWFDAPPLEGSGLVHGLVVLSEVAEPGAENAFRAALEGSGEKFTPLEPLVHDAHLSAWHSVKTQLSVGAKTKDFIQRLYVEAVVPPSAWTVASHEEAARAEGSCLPRLQSDAQGLTLYRASPERVHAPVRVTFIYNASRGSMKVARERFTQILKGLRIQPRAGTSL
jgi:hypothetical protein